MGNRFEVLKNISNHLDLCLADDVLKDIYDKHESIRETAWNFNKGTVNRWIEEMSGSEKEYIVS